MGESAWAMGQRRGTIRCLLMPLQGRKLLLPSVTVAEVLPVAQVRVLEGLPRGGIGVVEWRFTTVPLISFEAVVGEPSPQPGGSSRVAILHTLSRDGAVDFYALLLQGIPHLIQVRESELTLLQSKAGSEAVAARVEVQGQLATIPVLERLEELAGRCRPDADS